MTYGRVISVTANTMREHLHFKERIIHIGEHIKLKRRDFGKLISPNVMMMRSKWRSQEDVGDGGGMKRD